MQSRLPWREQGAASGGPREPSGKAVATVYNLIIVGPLKTLGEVQNLISTNLLMGVGGRERERGMMAPPWDPDRAVN